MWLSPAEAGPHQETKRNRSSKPWRTQVEVRREEHRQGSSKVIVYPVVVCHFRSVPRRQWLLPVEVTMVSAPIPGPLYLRIPCV